MQYDYHIETSRVFTLSDHLFLLRRLGRDGWELCSTACVEGVTWFYFRKAQAVQL